MKLTLPSGETVHLTPAMIRSLEQATLFPGSTDAWRPSLLTATTEADLIRWGLVAPETTGLPVLTARGMLVRDRLTASEAPETSEEPAGPGRATIDPALGPESTRRLASALNGRRPDGRPAWAVEHREGPGTAALALYTAAWCLLLWAVVPSMTVPLGLAVGTVSVAAVGTASLLGERRLRKEAEDDPERLVTGLADHHVTGDRLDAPAADLLGRAQRSVDAVLGSPLHGEGLLLDTARNRVVLTDTEWSLAQDLLRQTRTRERIASVPAEGARSREAADRARRALAEDVDRTAERVRVLERYAATVRAAEIEERERRTARELEGIAAETAGHGPPDDGLDALVRAQELALRLAAEGGGAA
ncbi:hypothetical protein [Nocardiopsis ganjiahuensis]|uniref:hypothetical protein n=1 Tax=Nocardiopsis ganjiahuensis TaxID=239984 RepID=UPI00034DCB12|nr:hypothetical protein [Nocardiopsis ganjiahuensis]